jgi:tripartite-type tricarboxylate transporter receptor subunit TctC
VRPIRTAAAAALLCALSICAYAADWPTRTITLISPYPPGGTNDAVGRLFADKLAAKLGQSIVVENKPGAAGVVGSMLVVRATPDGYTLETANNATHVIQPLINSQAKYDGAKDFTPIARYAVSYQFIGVRADLGVSTLPEFLALAKKNPGKFNFGSAGTGSFGHFSGGLLGYLSGAEFAHIPYRGSAQALTDLIGGRIEFMIDPLVTQQPEKVRVLATSAPERLPAYPNVPTTRELGMPEFDVVGWFGLFGPAGLPKDITVKLSDLVAEIAADETVRKQIETMGLYPGALKADEFLAVIKRDSEKFADIKRRAQIPNIE